MARPRIALRSIRATFPGSAPPGGAAEEAAGEAAVGLAAGEEVAQDAADAGVEAREGDHPLPHRPLVEEPRGARGPLHLARELVAQPLGIALGLAGQERLGGPGSGE